MNPSENQPSHSLNGLADWQKEAVLAARGVSPKPQDSASEVSQEFVPPQAATQPSAPNTQQPLPPAAIPIQSTAPLQTMPSAQPIQPAFTPPALPVQTPTPIPSSQPFVSQTQAQPKPKKHIFKKLVLVFGIIVIILVVAGVIALALKPKNTTSSNSNATITAKTTSKGREIPTDCYQFSIPFTHQFDLSTTNCTLSGGDGVQHELIGIQPVKAAKTDATELKNLSQIALDSFTRTYPDLKQTQQTTAQFAGKPALVTAATINNQQLTMYLVVPDKPYTIKNISYPAVLITYIGSSTQTDTLQTIETTWQWH